MKREYDEFKVRINGLPEVIRERSKMHNSKEEKKAKQLAKEKNGGTLPQDYTSDVPNATWMADGTHWPGTWYGPTADHSKGDHAGILQVLSLLSQFKDIFNPPRMVDTSGSDLYSSIK